MKRHPWNHFRWIPYFISLKNPLFWFSEFQNISNEFLTLQSCGKMFLKADHTAQKMKWDKVFKSGLGKFCGRQPLKNFKLFKFLKAAFTFLKAVFNKIYSVQYWILCLKMFLNADHPLGKGHERTWDEQISLYYPNVLCTFI